MIGIMGFLGIIAAVAACVTAISAGVGAYYAHESKEAQDKANAKAEVRNKKSMAMQKALAEKKANRLRNQAASGVLLAMYESNKLKNQTAKWNRKVSNVDNSRPRSRVNRGTYAYGSVHV